MTDNKQKARAWILAQTGGYDEAWGHWPGLLDILCDGLLAVVQAKGEMDRQGCADGVHTTYRDVPEPPR